MALWVEISSLIQTAFKNKNEVLIKNIFDLAEWFVINGPRSNKAENDSITSVYFSFYTHLPTMENAGYFISNYIPKQDFVDNKKMFIHLIDETKYSNILNEYNKRKI